MPSSNGQSLPKSFWIIGVIGLIWNAMGILNFFSQVTMGEEALAALEPAERALYDIPAWLSGVFAIAVFGGTLACVGLLLRKAWSIPVFVISLITIVIQMGYSVLMTPAVEVWGPGALVLPLMVTGVAVFLLWYARSAKGKGWIG